MSLGSICTKTQIVRGGTSEHKEIIPEVIEVCQKVKADLESKVGAKYDVFEPKLFKSQVLPKSLISSVFSANISNTETQNFNFS